MTKIFAHRGFRGKFPENTMLAFREAEKAGADGIELDVRLTKDGEVVIIHDATVDRTTEGKGAVSSLTLSELKTLNAGARFQKSRFREKIPTLDEFLQWMKPTRLICNIELKTETVNEHILEERVLALIRRYGLDDRIILSSFNHYSLVYCFRSAPHIETAVLYSEGLYMPWVYAESIRAKAIHPYYKVAPVELVHLSEQYGIRVRPFTVNEPEIMKKYFEAGTTAIITDHPDVAVRIRKPGR